MDAGDNAGFGISWLLPSRRFDHSRCRQVLPGKQNSSARAGGGAAEPQRSRLERGKAGVQAFRRSGGQAFRIGRDSSAFDLAGPERPNA